MIHVVTGHICSGKSTFVRNRAKLGDIVIDLDRIAMALTAEQETDYAFGDHVRNVAREARWSAIVAATKAHRFDAMGKRDASFDVWIVHAYPSERERREYDIAGAVFHDIKEPADVLLSRAESHRPADVVNELKKRLFTTGVGSGA